MCSSQFHPLQAKPTNLYRPTYPYLPAYPTRPPNNATMQQCNNATMQQCNDATMQQCNNATMQQCQQCNNSTMQQCNNATMEGTTASCVSRTCHLSRILGTYTVSNTTKHHPHHTTTTNNNNNKLGSHTRSYTRSHTRSHSSFATRNSPLATRHRHCRSAAVLDERRSFFAQTATTDTHDNIILEYSVLEYGIQHTFNPNQNQRQTAGQPPQPSTKADLRSTSTGFARDGQPLTNDSSGILTCRCPLPLPSLLCLSPPILKRQASTTTTAGRATQLPTHHAIARASGEDRTRAQSFAGRGSWGAKTLAPRRR